MTIALPAERAPRTHRIDLSWPVLILFAALLCLLIILPMSWLIYYSLVDRSGAFTLGRWGTLVNIAALAYGVLAMINMAWPRTPDVPWYDNWIVVLSALVVVGVGLVYMTVAKPYLRKDTPHGDAVRQPGAVSQPENV